MIVWWQSVGIGWWTSVLITMDMAMCLMGVVVVIVIAVAAAAKKQQQK